MIFNNAALRNSVEFHYKTRALPMYDDDFCLKGMVRVNWLFIRRFYRKWPSKFNFRKPFFTTYNWIFLPVISKYLLLGNVHKRVFIYWSDYSFIHLFVYLCSNSCIYLFIYRLFLFFDSFFIYFYFLFSRVIKKDLGAYPEELFLNFEEKPIASGKENMMKWKYV